MINRSFYTVFLGFLICFLLSACDDTVAPQPAQTPKASKAVVQSVAAAAVEEEEPEVEYVYDPVGTRDPFKNPLGVLAEIPVDASIPLTPLQKFDIDQLRVIGVIIGKGEPRAMVIAPDNKSFVLKKGTLIGRNNGSVVTISTDAIIIKEQFIDFSGDVKTTMQEIRLPKQGGVK